MPTFSIASNGNVTAGNAATFTVTMSGSITSPYTIWYSTLSGTASAADGDYSSAYVNQGLTLNPGGPTSQTISIPTLTDAGSSTEGNETFSVGLQATQTGNPYTSASTTILPNAAAAPTFSIASNGNVTAGNAATFTVTMSGSITSPYTIWYSTLSGTASAADGDSSSAYVNQGLTFDPGGPTSQTISIPTLTDAGSSTEGNETFSVRLQATQTGNPYTSASTTILPNAAAAAAFSIASNGNVTAGNAATFTVTMSGSITSPYTIWYSTLSGAASAADGDYSSAYVNQGLTFNPGGPTSQTISIPTLTDAGSSTEGNETFSVGLQAARTGNPYTSASTTILPNAAAAPTFSIASNGNVTAATPQPSRSRSAEASRRRTRSGTRPCRARRRRPTATIRAPMSIEDNIQSGRTDLANDLHSDPDRCRKQHRRQRDVQRRVAGHADGKSLHLRQHDHPAQCGGGADIFDCEQWQCDSERRNLHGHDERKHHVAVHDLVLDLVGHGVGGRRRLFERLCQSGADVQSGRTDLANDLHSDPDRCRKQHRRQRDVQGRVAGHADGKSLHLRQHHYPAQCGRWRRQPSHRRIRCLSVSGNERNGLD